MKKHRHDFKKKENYLVCECGKRVLDLEEGEKENLLVGVKSSGKKYTVRKNRDRYFFPDEWESFLNQIKDKEHRFFFITHLHTGGRTMEVLHLKHKDIDKDRKTITFNVVKQRKAKNSYSRGDKRTFFVASKFFKEYKSFTRGKKVNPQEYIFLDDKELPENYDSLTNKEKREFYKKKYTSYFRLFKRKLKKSDVEDYWNFSLHNIRKTYGNWMRIFEIEMAELCYRMGHDMDTFLEHYGSSLIFTPNERKKILKIMGEVK